MLVVKGLLSDVVKCFVKGINLVLDVVVVVPNRLCCFVSQFSGGKMPGNNLRAIQLIVGERGGEIVGHQGSRRSQGGTENPEFCLTSW